MTGDRALLDRIARQLDDAPLEAAALARKAELDGSPESWSADDHELVATAYSDAAQQLAMPQETAEETRRARTAAVDWLKASADAFAKADNMVSAAEVLEQAGELAFSMYQLELAEEVFHRAATLAQGTSEHDLSASCLSRLGTIRLHRGELDGAEAAFVNAQKAFEAADDLRGQANALGALGDVKTRQEDHDVALAHYERSLAILEEIGDKRGQAHALKALGSLKSATGDHDEAVSYLKGAIDLFRDAWDRVGEGNTYQALGSLEAKDPARADAMFREALANHAIASDLRGMAGDFGYIGRVAMRSGRFARAVLTLEHSLRLHHYVGAHREAIFNLRDQAEALLKIEGQTPTAMACLRLAIDTGSERGGLDTSALEGGLENLLSRVRAADADTAARIVERLGKAQTLKAQGLEKLLDEPSIVVEYFEDQIITAETLEDLDLFLEGLSRQALALADAGHHRGASATLTLFSQAIEQMPELRRQQGLSRLETLRLDLEKKGSIAQLNEESDDPEALRSEAVEALRG